MRKAIILSALSVSLMAPAMVPAAADAQGYNRGKQTHRHYRCKRSSGTTGLIAGGAGGALVGNALGGGVLGTVAGGVGGALLGKHLDKKHDAAQNRRRGC